LERGAEVGRIKGESSNLPLRLNLDGTFFLDSEWCVDHLWSKENPNPVFRRRRNANVTAGKWFCYFINS